MATADLQPYALQNTVLKQVDALCLKRLRLFPRRFLEGQGLANCDDPINHFLFLEAGSVALTVPLTDGGQVEVALLGKSSVVGTGALLGGRSSDYSVTVRSRGHGFSCSLEAGQQEFLRFGQFHDLILRSFNAQVRQTSQIAACNRWHDVSQRLCRWLLRCEDESVDQPIVATHESIGDALGVRRTTVTVAMESLRSQGLIIYSRGHIRITNRAALEQGACECYAVLQATSLFQGRSSSWSLEREADREDSDRESQTSPTRKAPLPGQRTPLRFIL